VGKRERREGGRGETTKRKSWKKAIEKKDVVKTE